MIACLYLAVQITANGIFGFGYFIDEFYYLACAKRLAAGYVDHPPLSILVLRLVIGIAGDSRLIIRLIPALAGSVSILLTGMLARKLGAGRGAAGLASLAIVTAPIYNIIFGFYSMNSLEILIWISLTFYTVRLVLEDNPRHWIAIGLLAGLGIENKHTMALYGAALFTGMLFTPQRKFFRSRFFWIGGAAAFILVLPNLIWQAGNSWPSIEFYINATVYKNISTPPWQTVIDQILSQNPALLPLWLSGVVFFFRGESLRALGWMYVILLTVMIVSSSSRPDRIVAAYPALFAAGAAAFDRFAVQKGRAWVFKAASVTALVSGLLLAPVGLPILPPEQLSRYAALIGVIPQIEKGKSTALPQWFGDRFDWEKVSDSVSAAYRSLSPSDQTRAVIFAVDYGKAGAIEKLGENLPPVISGHNSWYLWGPGPATGEVVIAVGMPREKLLEFFEEVVPAGGYSRRYSRDENIGIFICRRLKRPLREIWPRIRFFV